jgi:tetratricopeptide (TPR) repeat protein
VDARVKKLSGFLYNKGLYAARDGRLTEAAALLQKSLAFDGRAVKTRNLLGLVNFKIGRLTEALKHWIISDGLEKKGNPAGGYISRLQNDQRFIERLNDAAAMYNQALAYCAQRSEDIAVIQLKRALDIYPDMLDALNLLSLCLLNGKDKGKAVPYVERALILDKTNPFALRYYRASHPDGRGIFSAAPERVPRREAAFREPRRPAKTGVFAQFISFAIGAGCALAVAFLLIAPSMTAELKKQIAELTLSGARLEAEFRLAGESAAAKETELNFLLKESEERSAALDAALSEKSVFAKVQAAYYWALTGRSLDAAVYLGTLRKDSLSAESLALYEEAAAVAYPEIEASYYEDGVRSFNAKAYDEAKTLFETALPYASGLAGEITYYLGRCAEAGQDADAAAGYYAAVSDKYPDCRFANDAKKRLNRLGA